MLRDCPIDHRCMTAITADDVFTRAVALLDQAHVVEASVEVGAHAEAAR
jgi:hypothetical protein